MYFGWKDELKKMVFYWGLTFGVISTLSLLAAINKRQKLYRYCFAAFTLAACHMFRVLEYSGLVACIAGVAAGITMLIGIAIRSDDTYYTGEEISECCVLYMVIWVLLEFISFAFAQ